MIKLLLAAALFSRAAKPAAPAVRAEPKLLTPVMSGGTPVVYRMIRLDVPANESARIDVALAKDGTECFDTSIIEWNKSMVGTRRIHSLNFDAGKSRGSAGCTKRASGQLGLHTVTLAPEKGGMHVVITYREGTEVSALLEK